MRVSGCGVPFKGLEERGIFGVVVLVGGHVHMAVDTCPKIRHIHPKEVGLFNGVPCRCFDSAATTEPLRLLLAGAGQMPAETAAVEVRATESAVDPIPKIILENETTRVR